MSTSLQRNTIADQPRAGELRPEALAVVQTLHDIIKNWVPESECTPTELEIAGVDVPPALGEWAYLP